MTAEGNLYNPAIFAPLATPFAKTYLDGLPDELRALILAVPPSTSTKAHEAGYPDTINSARTYLAIIRYLKTPTASSAIRSHLFRMFKPIFEHGGRYLELREQLSRVGGNALHEERVSEFISYIGRLADALEVCRVFACFL